MAPQIRSVCDEDAAAIAAIYNHYIEHTVITFEESPVSASEMRQRVQQTRDAELPWFVVCDDEALLGYAYASRWNGRCAYRHTAEITVYLAPDAGGKGLGTALYEALFAALTQLDTHTVIAGIALPNAASIALHERFGMHKVAHFSEVGYKFDQWIDVAYWQGDM